MSSVLIPSLGCLRTLFRDLKPTTRWITEGIARIDSSRSTFLSSRAARIPFSLSPSLLPLFLPACGGAFLTYTESQGPQTTRPVLSLNWRTQLTFNCFDGKNHEEFSSPEVDRTTGRIFIGSSSGRLYALEPTRGNEIWHFQSNGAIVSRPRVIPELGRVIIASDEGHLYALKSLDGKEAWNYAVGDSIMSQPVYHEGLIYVATNSGNVVALEAKTGRWRWNYQREKSTQYTLHGHSGVTVAKGRVFCGFSDGSIASLDAKTGDLLWDRQLDPDQFSDIDATPLFDQGKNLLYIASHSGGVSSLRAYDGTMVWSASIQGVTGMTLSHGTIYLASTREGIMALNPQTAGVIWRQYLGQGVPAAPLASQNYLITSTSEGGLWIVNPKNGKPLSFFPPGGGISSRPTLEGNTLYFLTNEGYFYSANLTL